MRYLPIGVLVVVILIAGLALGVEDRAASQAVPTPRGQLGGAVSLTPEPVLAPGTRPPDPTGTGVSAQMSCVGDPATPGSLDPNVAATPASIATAERSGPDDVDAATTVAVGALLQRLVDCTNTGDGFRQAALVTDAYLGRLTTGEISPWPFTLDRPLPLSPTITIESIGPIGAMPDGRLSVEVRFTPTSDLAADQLTFVIARIGPEWKIDDIAIA